MKKKEIRKLTEIVKITERLNVLILDWTLPYLFILLVAGLIVEIKTLFFDIVTVSTIIIYLLNFIIIPLVLNGRSMFQILFNIKILYKKNGKQIYSKTVILRLIFRLIFYLPILSLFFLMFFKNKKNPWYDEILEIQMIWSKTPRFSKT